MSLYSTYLSFFFKFLTFEFFLLMLKIQRTIQRCIAVDAVAIQQGAYIFCYRVITILPSNFVILVSIFIFILQRQCNRKSLGRVVKILRLVISQQGSDHLLVAPQTSRDGLAESDFD